MGTRRRSLWFWIEIRSCGSRLSSRHCCLWSQKIFCQIEKIIQRRKCRKSAQRYHQQQSENEQIASTWSPQDSWSLLRSFWIRLGPRLRLLQLTPMYRTWRLVKRWSLIHLYNHSFLWQHLLLILPHIAIYRMISFIPKIQLLGAI